MIAYLAARYSRRLELCGYRTQLESYGIEVTSRWLNGAHQLSDVGMPIGDHGEQLVEAHDVAGADLLRCKFAQDDLDDVTTADTLIAFTEVPRASNSRGGRHVEFGIALGQGKAITLIGPRENVFAWLPTIEHHDTWQDYLAVLTQLRTP
jgi:hypothetical protein